MARSTKSRILTKLVLYMPVVWLIFIVLLLFNVEDKQREKNDVKVNEEIAHNLKMVKQDEIVLRKKMQETSIIEYRRKLVKEQIHDSNFVEGARNVRKGFEQLAKDAEKRDRTLNWGQQNAVVDKKQISRKSEVESTAPGEYGRPVVINAKDLSAEERRKYESGWNSSGFNTYVSDRISLHRKLPDMRDKACKNYTKDDISSLPTTSVIICFVNEGWSVLLRTVHSVIDRSPKRLLKEIILVDDFSDAPHTKEPLDKYMRRLRIVKIIRAKKREGLIRARLLGVAAATGDVLTFLDSHCECTPGWLPPILDVIKNNPNTSVTPVIDIISDDTFEFFYGKAELTQLGGFDWNLGFTWFFPPNKLQRERKKYHFVAPVRSPTMAGGLFSIQREYFHTIGTYDAAMDIWGGENLELSFRIWMCGGALVTHPCSQVGHIFRGRNGATYSKGKGDFLKKNLVRLAEVWLDDYKKYYYEKIGYDLGDYGDVSERRELRKRLKCKSFSWFLRNIHPEMFIPGEALASGEIRNAAMSMCVDSPAGPSELNKKIQTYGCHGQGGNQVWYLSKIGQIRRDDYCLDYNGSDLILYRCHHNRGPQEWSYEPGGQIRHVDTGRCLQLSVNGDYISMVECYNYKRQIWYWKRQNANS